MLTFVIPSLMLLKTFWFQFTGDIFALKGEENTGNIYHSIHTHTFKIVYKPCILHNQQYFETEDFNIYSFFFKERLQYIVHPDCFASLLRKKKPFNAT